MEKIRIYQLKSTSLKKRLVDASLRASRRSREMIRRAIESNRKISRQTAALAAIEHSIAEERARDSMLKSAKRIANQLVEIQRDSKEKARAAISEEGIKGRLDRLRRNVDQEKRRLASEISATEGYVQAAGKGFDRARTMMLRGREGFREEALEVRVAVTGLRGSIEGSRRAIAKERVNFEGDVRDAQVHLHEGGEITRRLMVRNLLDGADDFRGDVEERRGEIAAQRESLGESISVADRRFKFRAKEVKESWDKSAIRRVPMAPYKRSQFEKSGKELARKFRESIDSARTSLVASAAEKKEMIVARSGNVKREGQIRSDRMKSTISNGRELFLLDVRFAQHNLKEASKRLKTGGNKAIGELAVRREKQVGRARAERKATLIRNALALIRSTS